VAVDAVGRPAVPALCARLGYRTLEQNNTAYSARGERNDHQGPRWLDTHAASHVRDGREQQMACLRLFGVAGHDEGHQPSGPDYRRGVTSTSRLTSSPSRMFATASGGSTIFTFDPSADRTVTSPLLRSTSVILPAS
jgi:hypothetical protein